MMLSDVAATPLPYDLDAGAILTFIGGVVVTAIGALARRSLRQSEAKKHDAQGEASLASVTLDWAAQLRADLENSRKETEKRLAQMSTRISALERENEIYRKHNTLLTKQIIEAGLVPAPRPRLQGDGES
ncbi:MAG: hypothetical protein ACOC9T_03265 [Myxococcota bacterium]